MSTNVGNLNATLSLSAFEFNSGLKQSSESAKEFATTVEVQSARAETAVMKAGKGGSGLGKVTGVVQQAGFMIQDFSSQIGTRGIGPAIGAVTNNVQMLGMAFGPVPAAISAVGGALAGILLPRLIETGSIFGKTAEEADQAMSKMKKSVEGALAPWKEFQQQRFDISEGGEKSLDDLLKKITQQGKVMKAEASYLRQSAQMAANLNNMEQSDQLNQLAREKEAEMGTLRTRWNAINALRPEAKATDAAKAADKKREEDEKAHFDGLKKRDDFEKNLQNKSAENYGTEMQRVDARIERERKEMMLLRVDAETQKRFDAMSKVDRQKAAISQAEKDLAEMGQAAGMSAGVNRNSAEGVRAINRATSGTASEQSLMKESIRVQKDSLKQLEQIARNPLTVVQVSLSG